MFEKPIWVVPKTYFLIKNIGFFGSGVMRAVLRMRKKSSREGLKIIFAGVIK
jgi:hypothetical protein